jgi:predicted nucleic acid-binding protein
MTSVRRPVETERCLRAVFDTNIFVAAYLSKSPNSPTVELLQRWLQGEFELLYSDDLLAEIDEKLVEAADIQPIILSDPDDDFVLACAIVGQADYLVSYDAHFDVLEGEYQGIQITEALPFLWAVRGEKSPL